MENARQIKGQEIANKQDAITRIDENHYTVKSQTVNLDYDVVATESGWKCTCPDHTYRKVCCKHIHAVEVSIELRKEIEKTIIIEPVKVDSCPKCKSNNVVKHGIRHNRNYDIQRLSCKDCSFRFSINLGFERMKASPQIITSAMQLYFSGESFRNVQKFLRLQGIEVNHKTIYNWVKRYVSLMEKYLEDIVPKVGDVWRADELYVRIKGKPNYIYALMDDDTRFWLAKQVSEKKYTEDVKPMFKDAMGAAQKRPRVMITDGAKNFMEASKVFYTNEKPRTVHIRHIHIRGDMNNNKMERLNGEIRDREKVMRGIKRDDSPVISGYQIYHNYIRPHMALEGQTPADKAGIDIKGENRWITLIQNASIKKQTFVRSERE
ncbi:IS6 family transposase [Candidatus Nitrosotenuis uzonensis]|uniref:Putative integrase family protein n=1 Tax=Candidatus Nitrosotenuis uzonensis TaxID=1407055 RepID=A0A812EUL0_9ARCH|nr:IS6 family transposase [Candidatus Nitrosotenuis uzonensis]CAE6488977.1 putative integrase family protein [Candidatus Nitrosotenuis uzonensis]